MGMVTKKYKVQGLADLVPVSVFLSLKDSCYSSRLRSGKSSRPHF